MEFVVLVLGEFFKEAVRMIHIHYFLLYPILDIPWPREALVPLGFKS